VLLLGFGGFGLHEALFLEHLLLLPPEVVLLDQLPPRLLLFFTQAVLLSLPSGFETKHQLALLLWLLFLEERHLNPMLMLSYLTSSRFSSDSDSSCCLRTRASSAFFCCFSKKAALFFASSSSAFCSSYNTKTRNSSSLPTGLESAIHAIVIS